MPDKNTLERAAQDKREGKAATTLAGGAPLPAARNVIEHLQILFNLGFVTRRTNGLFVSSMCSPTRGCSSSATSCAIGWSRK